MLTLDDVVAAERPGVRRLYGMMCSGIEVYRHGYSLLLIPPNSNYRVLSSGFTNGGFMDSPEAITNTSSMGEPVESLHMGKGLDLNDRITLDRMRNLGLDPMRCVCMGTAAHMNNAAIVNIDEDGRVPVSIAITGGIRGNGGRAGDPASYDELVSNELRHGTIIMLISIDADLSDNAMFEAMLLATEAKSCVIQELQAKSLYSDNIATGSGTDQVAIISNRNSRNKVSHIGKETDLGMDLANCCKRGLYETFDRQSDMTHDTQCDPLVQASRIKVTDHRVKNEIRYPAEMRDLVRGFEELHADKYSAAVVTAILHIADEARHGIISNDSALRTSKRMITDVLLKDVWMDNVCRVRFEKTEDIVEALGLALSLLVLRNANRGKEVYDDVL